MSVRLRGRPGVLWVLFVLIAVTLGACNLGAAPPEDEAEITPGDVVTLAPTRTVQGTDLTRVATTTPIPFSTSVPTSIGQASTPVPIIPPTVPPRPTNTTAPTSIVIISPLAGNVVSGNVQVIGSAIHPNFLQYRLEYGPDPNPNNLWFSITGIVQTPVLGSVLGVWTTNTGGTPDGTYQLRLRVFLRDGTQQVTQVGGIRVRNQQPTPVPTNTTVPPPVASFTQDRTSGEAPLVVRFTNRSQGQITGYSWNFGDGGSSAAVNPTYTYQEPGIYTVTLRVTGPGASVNVSRQITVNSPEAPEALFVPSVTSGEAPLQVSFENRSSGQIDSYSWDFGDGSDTSTEESPTHTYNDVGTFNVILTVEGAGGSDTYVSQITVEDPAVPPPQADFSASPQSGEAPLTVTFTNLTTGEATQYLWDFNGDGVTDSTEESPTHLYEEPGTYAVRLIAIGEGGQTTIAREILVEAPPDAPVVSFTAEPTSGDAPLTVSFSNTTSGEVTSYEWDFDGDGVTDDTDESPSHTYADAGTYTVRLTATGPGGTDSAEATISVTTPIVPPTAAFSVDPASGDAPLIVTFNNESEGTQLEYAWDFDGDGTVDATEAGPHSFEFAQAGTYTAALTVSNEAGSDSTTQEIVVNEPLSSPVAQFSANPTSGDVPLTVAFTNESTGEITSYAWDFDGDGVVDSDQQAPAPFTYQQPGTYNASLTVSNDAGSDSVAVQIVVNAPVAAPVAGFTADPPSGDAPLTVTFTDTSQGDNLAYAWDFDGDGVIDSDQPNPAPFTYQQPGTYNATLTVSNDAGSDSIAVQIVVNAPVAAPVAGFTADPPSGDAPLTVTFTDTSQGDNLAYAWDFDGDGVIDSDQPNPAPFTYQQPGTYNASLTVSNDAGSDSIAVQIVVNAPVAAPVAGFTADPTSGDAPLTVTFTDTSQGDNLAYAWDFDGDGVVDSDQQAPAPFTYQQPGTYNASLTVSNDAGSDTISQEIVINEVTAEPQPITGVLLFVSDRDGNNEIYAANADGSGAVNITNNPASDTNPVWSPDGSQIAFVSDRDGNSEIYLLDVNDQSITRLTNDAAVDTQPAWSPDGSQIAFVSNRFGDNDIWVVDAQGGEPTQRTFDVTNDQYPTWSPDGSQIAYVTNANGNDDIFIITSNDGTFVSQLTTDGNNDRFPDWSNDGIVFVSNRDGQNELYISAVDGNPPTRVTNNGANDRFPRWTPDGQIIYSSNLATDGSGGTADQNIYLINPDGSGATPLTTDPSNESNPALRAE